MAPSNEEPQHLTGEQLRDRGIANVLDADNAVHRGVRELIERTLDRLIDQGSPFTADDVHALLPEDAQPHSSNLLPAAFRTYRVAGLITQVGWSTSTRPTRHAGVVRMWIGAEHPEAAA